MAGSQRSRQHSRWWGTIRFVAGLALGALALRALNGDRGELAGASKQLAHLRPGWLLFAIALEMASVVSYAYLQKRLLASAGTRVGLGWMAAVSFAALTIASSVPAGPAFSSIFSYRQYRRRGVEETLAGWTLLATLVCAALGLALLATAGVLLATAESASYDLIGVVLGVLAVTAAVDAVVWQRGWLARVATLALRLSRRVLHRPRRQAAAVVDAMLERLGAVTLSWRDVLATVLAGMANWAFDCGCLACAFGAVGAPVPWRGLLLAYGAGQLAQNLPITPGGLGVVEGSLTIALVAFGGAEVTSVAAVLLYRIVTFWGYLPLGWADWAILTYLNRRTDRLEIRARAAEAATRARDGFAAAVGGGPEVGAGVLAGPLTPARPERPDLDAVLGRRERPNTAPGGGT